MKKFFSVLLVVAMLLSLSACAELFSKVEEQVAALDLNKIKEVSLDMGASLNALLENSDDLTDEEQSKLDKLLAEYKKLEEKAIAELEAQINKLPKEEEVEPADENIIKAARNAYDALPEDVREKIGNVDLLVALEKALDLVKNKS